ncbi:MAG: hypothetical protein DME26_00295, partial [Verrucomicrobia bacterium]
MQLLQLPWEKVNVLAGFGALLLVTGCSQKVPPSVTNEKRSSAAPAYESILPHIGGPPGYVGSKACRSCHEDQFESWHRSYHRSMTQIAAADTVRADFHNVALTNEGNRFVLGRTNNEFWVHMERVALPAPGETLPEPVDVRVGLVTGSHHMQVFWVPTGEGNTQVGFPFTWLIPEKRWVPRNATFVRPPEL